jgi:uncharacterized protein (TIGR03067 family)
MCQHRLTIASVVLVVMATGLTGAGQLGYSTAVGGQKGTRQDVVVSPQLNEKGKDPKGDQPIRDEQDALEGGWTPVAVNVQGKGEVEYPRKNQLLIFKGDTFQRKDGGKVFQSGRIVLYPTEKPKKMDMILTDRSPEARLLVVYELKDNRLTICYEIADLGGEPSRPTGLMPGGNRSVVVYERKAKNK